MLAAIGMMACPNLAVPAEVMRHVVDVESGANPYAIGVVGGQLVRQPKNLGEALATVHMLDAKGYNYSLGVAQVNRANLGKYGLDSYEKAFEACPNLAAGAQILAACYASSGGDWGKAFSCYYSGNFVTGYRDGYVQKVYDSINRGAGIAAGADSSRAIPLKAAPEAPPGEAAKMAIPVPGSPGYRAAIRSVAFYTTTASAVSTDGAAVNQSPISHAIATPASPAHAPTTPVASAAPAPPAEPVKDAPNTVASASIFVPQVTGPNDPPPESTSTGHATSPQMASATADAVTNHAHPGQESRDAAFVF